MFFLLLHQVVIRCFLRRSDRSDVGIQLRDEVRVVGYTPGYPGVIPAETLHDSDQMRWDDSQSEQAEKSEC